LATALKPTQDDDRFVDYFGPADVIVTSGGTNNSGIFETTCRRAISSVRRRSSNQHLEPVDTFDDWLAEFFQRSSVRSDLGA
jgi:hypothetical protein